MLLRICWFALALASIMSCYEWAKQLLLPQITLWQSHLITIAFTTLSGTCIMFLVLIRLNRLNQQMQREVEQRRHIEVSLRTSETRFKTLFETIRAVIWFSSADGSELSLINPEAERIYGLTRQEMQISPAFWLLAVHPEDRDRAEASGREVLGRGQSETEYRIVRPDGSTRWLQDRKQAVYADNGEISALVGIATDITERKEFEETLTSALKEREALVRELYHRTQNNMQVIRGMLSLQCEGIQDTIWNKIRDDQGYWNRIETYIQNHSEAHFSHGICPECAKKLYPDMEIS
ncbi:MAG: PAS domain-containing protein [Desulfohalobiaceae bacterium]|nr:PAS domain-containing protein [Desulfohalobiaceae bacterium]